MPSTSLVPMADNFNHANVNVNTYLTSEYGKQHEVQVTEPNFDEDNDTDTESDCPLLEATSL